MARANCVVHHSLLVTDRCCKDDSKEVKQHCGQNAYYGLIKSILMPICYSDPILTMRLWR